MHSVAYSGDYNALNNKPYIPSGGQFYGVTRYEEVHVGNTAFQYIVPYNCICYAYGRNNPSIKATVNGIDISTFENKLPLKAGTTINFSRNYSYTYVCMYVCE